MKYPDIASELVKLKRHDLAIRQRLIEEGKLFGGYNPEMEVVHLDNADRLQTIIQQIGYPTIEKVGADASQAAWLIVQHAISLPGFMKNCLSLMELEAQAGNIDPVNVAFLTDRIAMYENRPQALGTQFISDENGELIAYQLDVPVAIANQRRKNLGLNTVEERLAELKSELATGMEPRQTQEAVAAEKAEYDNWRRKTGWIS